MEPMKRRDFLATAASTAAALSLPRLGPAAETVRKPPNILLILADDIGAKELGCYGNTEHATPNLDALARGGAMFKTCYVTPLCSPTRAETMTGRYAFRTGWYNLIGRPYAPKQGDPQWDLAKNEITHGMLLKAHGYATALAGKWQLPGEHPTLIHECGFDEYCMWAYAHNLPAGAEYTGGYESPGKTARYWHPSIVQNGEYIPTQPTDYGPDIHAQFLIDFMKRHQDGPFFAYHPICLTHGPHEPTPDPNAPGGKTEGGLKTNVEYMDKIVGRLIKAIDDLGIRQNTILFLIGDNGTGGQGKGQVTELGVHVPLIVNCPGTVKAGLVSDELVDGSDLFPTIAEFARADLPGDRVIDGRSFAPILRGEKGNPREWIFSCLATKHMLRDKRWLLEGNGKFYDCGDSRDGTGYRDVTGSNDPEVLVAKRRFAKILEGLPAAEPRPEAEKQEADLKAKRRAQTNRETKRAGQSGAKGQARSRQEDE